MEVELSATHLDLFSGIGGFAIAARAAGFRTVAFCESDARCRTFLEKTWQLPVHDDIRTFDAKRYYGISLLTGGPPCQPASRAGKQGGSGDDRWLWPEALRVLGEAEPDCVVFENPPGIGDVGLDGILSEMGRLGYEVQVFDIPACAVDSPQLRHRFWIVGFLADAKVRGQRTNGSAPGSCGHTDERDQSGLLANPNERGLQERRSEGRAGFQGRDSQDEPDAIPNADSEECMADPRCERSGQDEQERGTQGRAIDRRDCENELADTAGPGRERPDAERGENGCRPQRPQSLNSNVGNSECEREQRRAMPTGGESRALGGTDRPTSSHGGDMADAERKGREPASEQDGESLESRQQTSRRPDANGCGLSHWQNSVWVPCADGKLRRAPDDSFELVDGPHRSLLAALGNAIVWQVAAEIIKAAKQVIDA